VGSPDHSLVLIVDDDDRNRKLAADVLGAAGFRTLDAADGAQAIALAAAHLPDVILMDLRLPDLDGVEVTRRLHADPRMADIPVVALSATPLEPDDDWPLDAGFAAYLVKPIDIDTFPGLVRRLRRSRTP
jgi:two-component system, cell cycle response regulator DivK